MKLTNFKSVLFLTQFDFNNINDFQLFEKNIQWLIDSIRLDKVYIETYRSGHFVPLEKIQKVKEILKKHNIETSGGITVTDDSAHGGSGLFKPFCYTNPLSVEMVKKIARITAELFDEFILDDFFFTNCKCNLCISAKKDQSWPDFRLELMATVADELIIQEARKVNKDVKVILKYPNWYDDYHIVGYNLEIGTSLFDGIYTGTETRDPVHTQQNIQRYSSYFLMRYLENVSPKHNLGGWLDTLDCSYSLNSVVEQANLTLFAGAKECTVFSFGAITGEDSIFAPLLGYTYERYDQLNH